MPDQQPESARQNINSDQRLPPVIAAAASPIDDGQETGCNSTSAGIWSTLPASGSLIGLVSKVSEAPVRVLRASMTASSRLIPDCRRRR